MVRHPASLFVATIACIGAREAHADTFTITSADDLIGAVAALTPGDELVLSGGTYNLTQRFGISVSGTADMPIVIRAADGETPIITRPDANENAVNIEDAAYVELRGLEVTGGSHGIRIADSDYITIEACHIHDTDDVALSANVNGSNYEGLRFLRNHIHDTNNTGEGMYLGCNSNACQFHDALIEGNYIHNTNGPTIAQGDGIEIKEGSYGNVVRDNVIHDTNYPCIITYSTVGNGPPNRIERNALWACGDHAIQSAADVVIVNNIILDANADAIRNQPHQAGDPQNISIVNNTIIKPAGDAIRSDGIIGSMIIANNAIYAQNGNAIRLSGDTSAVTVLGNVGIGSLQNVAAGFSAAGNLSNDFVAASFSGGPPNDVFPSPGSALVGAADVAQLATDDFNGTLRAGQADVGAYRYDPGGNPGWTIVAGFKDSVPVGPGEGGAAAGGNGAGGSTESGGNGAGAAGAGAGGAGNTGSDDSMQGDVESCACRMALPPSTEKASGLLLAVAAVAARRRRKRAR